MYPCVCMSRCGHASTWVRLLIRSFLTGLAVSFWHQIWGVCQKRLVYYKHWWITEWYCYAKVKGSKKLRDQATKSYYYNHKNMQNVLKETWNIPQRGKMSPNNTHKDCFVWGYLASFFSLGVNLRYKVRGVRLCDYLSMIRCYSPKQGLSSPCSHLHIIRWVTRERRFTASWKFTVNIPQLNHT